MPAGIVTNLRIYICKRRLKSTARSCVWRGGSKVRQLH